MEVSDRDLLNPNTMRDTVHGRVLAYHRMSRALAARSCHSPFVFARNAGHCEGTVEWKTPPAALEYVWQGCPNAGAKVAQRTP
jgi:hypothetical protein